ncbi:hypothetical protein GCM10022251_31170 [Phytohabitans flavus]
MGGDGGAGDAAGGGGDAGSGEGDLAHDVGTHGEFTPSVGGYTARTRPGDADAMRKRGESLRGIVGGPGGLLRRAEIYNDPRWRVIPAARGACSDVRGV